MKKSKSSLLRIEKTKEGIPIIHLRKLSLRNSILACLAIFIYFAGLTWFLRPIDMNLSVTLFPWLFLAIGLYIAFIVLIFFVFFQQEIRLEPDFISIRSRYAWLYTRQVILAQNLFSVYQEAARSPFSGEAKSYLILHLATGKHMLLELDFEKEIHAGYVLDFINRYYGLDEKPKTSNE